ncbi:MAG: MHS family MFS transporter [Pseudonocardia sp.]|uniref:MFS transporter n=1 Tax=unclassified Pseudonocardia TaxID=2619320 RepID=UPI00086C6C4B|nr:MULTISPECIES: MFS transporter [unclassified Pseudonocardia]MBN9113023.1 MHS family MFS transporter [Pseudonocardia sp.]ODU28390.1 MAG: MFS transporter [Pseudonocardia sp. SCN 72-51]ODV05499.1 MAG: MFS transporter [Pseudonocardia sp. SCN 73-27]
MSGETAKLDTPVSARKIALASAIGTTIEWYDFLIYATAASLVFGKIFFPTGSALVSSLLAVSTIGAGFLARPLGAIVLSNYGDKVGRKSLLVGTLGAMGIATTLIGLLPTYAQIGIWAPILLVLLRLVQGIAVGGEWGGAVLMAIEHAPRNRRGFYGSLVQIGFPVGMALGTFSFLLLALLPEPHFLSWGWRIPFLVSAVLVVVGLVIRLKVTESPEFEASREKGELVKYPVWEAVRRHPKNLLIGLGARITELSWIYVLTIFALEFATHTLHIPRTLVLAAIGIGALLELVTVPLCGALSDRVGRRAIYIAGSVAAGLLAFPVFWAIASREGWAVVLAFTIGMAVGHGVMYGVQASFLSEMFGANVRYSGASLGYQLAAPIGGGLVPVLATWIVGVSGGTWGVSVMMIVLALITVVAVYFAKETAAGKAGGTSSAHSDSTQSVSPPGEITVTS